MPYLFVKSWLSYRKINLYRVRGKQEKIFLPNAMVIIPVYWKYNENKGAYFTEFANPKKRG